MKKDKKIEGIHLYFERKAKTKYRKGGFGVLGFDRMTEILADKKTFTGEILRVLMMLMTLTDIDGRIIRYTHKEIADLINVKRPQVTKAIKILRANNVIYEDKRDLYVDDALLWRGVEHEMKDLNKEPE
jgi:DNA-binding MarR family transcriptional regulator